MEIGEYKVESAKIQHDQLVKSLLKWGFTKKELTTLVQTSNKIFVNGKFIGYYQFFKSVREPLFYFFDKTLLRNREEKFFLTLSGNMVPCIDITGEHVTEHLDAYLRRILIAKERVVCDLITVGAVRYAKGETKDENKKEILIEIWNPQSAETVLRYLQLNYKPPVQPKEQSDVQQSGNIRRQEVICLV